MQRAQGVVGLQDAVAKIAQYLHGRRANLLVVFGDPTAGTAVMEAEPLAALDLPLKVLVWVDGDRTRVSYLSPTALADRYGLDSEVARNVSGIDPLTDALVGP